MYNLILIITALVSLPVAAIDVSYTDKAPVIDGIDNDPQWQKASWMPLDQIILGGPISAQDFSGKFRLLWDKNKLYLQAIIVDDVLVDTHADPTENYWDDDCLEIFIDEDASGGDHQYNYNAFAYHVALDNQAADIGPDHKAKLYNDHITSRWKRSQTSPHEIVWEVAIYLYPDTYQDGADNLPVALNAGKNVGFMLAYCDNDHSETREHFIGSTAIEAVDGDKNRGWIDASVFNTLVLRK